MARGKRKSNLQEEATPEGEEEVEASQSQKMCFSQHAAEASRGMLKAKASEQRNFDNLPADQREKLVMDVSRVILFKALAGEAIDRKTACKEAGIATEQGRVSNAVFQIAGERLRNVFGFELKRLPEWMQDQKSTKKKYQERHYLITSDNTGENDKQQGDHSKTLCAQHGEVAVSKGLLMVVLSLVYCKGDLRADGSRWIMDADLYRLLNAIDENIPKEPPSQGSKKASERFKAEDKGLAMTPDVDASLEGFVKQDYLLKEKITYEQIPSIHGADENTFLYALGPRAALEVGRKQIVHFCAEILDVEPDNEMIEEIERDDKQQEEMEE